MCLWHFNPEEPVFQIVPRSTRRFQLALLGVGMLVLHTTIDTPPVVSFTFASAAPIQLQRSGKVASSYVGAAMAVLATLEQGHVLPPEGTAEANRIIKSVIQLQSLFTNNTDPAVQEFLQRAVAIKHGDQSAQVLTRFHSHGWTPDVLDALADMVARDQVEALARLAPGLASVNLSTDDLQHFLQLVRDGARALASDGRNFHDVFASFRKTMPGAAGR
jgi:hypothetical protein